MKAAIILKLIYWVTRFYQDYPIKTWAERVRNLVSKSLVLKILFQKSWFKQKTAPIYQFWSSDCVFVFCKIFKFSVLEYISEDKYGEGTRIQTVVFLVYGKTLTGIIKNMALLTVIILTMCLPNDNNSLDMSGNLFIRYCWHSDYKNYIVLRVLFSGAEGSVCINL